MSIEKNHIVFRFADLGFGNLINLDRVLVLTTADTAPAKRMISDAKDRGTLIDATAGKKTRTVIVLDSDHLVLSACEVNTLKKLWLSDLPEESFEDEA